MSRIGLDNAWGVLPCGNCSKTETLANVLFLEVRVVLSTVATRMRGPRTPPMAPPPQDRTPTLDLATREAAIARAAFNVYQHWNKR